MIFWLFFCSLIDGGWSFTVLYDIILPVRTVYGGNHRSLASVRYS